MKHALIIALFNGIAIFSAHAQTAPQPAINAPAPLETANKVELAPLVDFTQTPGSIFFTPEETEQIHSALKDFVSNGGVLTSKKKEDEDKKTAAAYKPAGDQHNYTYPQFYLESLVYHSPVDWQVRINGTVLSPQATQFNSLRLVSIDKEEVGFEWHPAEGERIVYPQESVPGVSFDRNAGIINFTVRVNQTFSSYAMRILEGKVQPVIMPLREADKAVAGEKAKPSPSTGENTGNSLQKSEGLNGLLNAYQRIEGK